MIDEPVSGVLELAAVASAKGEALRAGRDPLGATEGLFAKLGLAPLEKNRQVRALYRDDRGGSLAPRSTRAGLQP